MPEPLYLAVGRVLRPHGVRGEVRVQLLTDFPERLKQHAAFYLARPESPEEVQRHPVESMRFHQQLLRRLVLLPCPGDHAAEAGGLAPGPRVTSRFHRRRHHPGPAPGRV